MHPLAEEYIHHRKAEQQQAAKEAEARRSSLKKAVLFKLGLYEKVILEEPKPYCRSEQDENGQPIYYTLKSS